MHLNLSVFSLTQILCLWHSPPGILVHPHTRVLIYLHTYNKTQAGITSKQGQWMQRIDLNIEGNKTWQVNAQLTGNLKYLQAKHTIHKGRKHRSAK